MMVWVNEWVEADEWFTCKGPTGEEVKVYHAYSENEKDQGIDGFHFMLDETGTIEDHGISIRRCVDLADKYGAGLTEPVHPGYLTAGQGLPEKEVRTDFPGGGYSVEMVVDRSAPEYAQRMADLQRHSDERSVYLINAISFLIARGVELKPEWEYDE